MCVDQLAPRSSTPKRAVTIAICTFRRPDGLRAAIESIVSSHQLPKFAELAEILVVDNDPAGSGCATVESIDNRLVRYVHEPRPGVTWARNAALDHAAGDIVCFLDDDEVVAENWPGGLIDVMAKTSAALTGGPVATAFAESPPAWIIDGGFFDRDDPANEAAVDWLRTGNLAIDLRQIREHKLNFDPAFNESGGEDVAFSRAVRAAGLSLRWSKSASVTELVPPTRVTKQWLVDRERVATANYVRARRSSESFANVAISVIPRLTVRFLAGAGALAIAQVQRSKVRQVRAQMSIARALGTIDGLRGVSSASYGGST